MPHATGQLSPCAAATEPICPRTCALQQEMPLQREACPLQQEKALGQQQKPSTAKHKLINFLKRKKIHVSLMFIAVLFTTAKTWKQPKCTSTDEWIKILYTHTHTHTHGILLGHRQKEWNNATCSSMHRPRDLHTKWGKSEKDKYLKILLICGI